MKLVVFACLASMALAFPQGDPRDVEAVVLKDVRSDSGDGNFNFEFETSNGIYSQRTGTPGSKGQSDMTGSFRFNLPDGTVAEVRYVADELGYRPESPLIPTPHPLPPHAIEQIRVAEEQRAKGITFEK
ncbi:cuticle protein AM1159 [Procambarus clarkii]|uniref:cuticle protein AM1159 n=1 Tax=Procambarus clarkii TaxID=6728 RepID=UPI001E677C8F|nr:cuticle protein AM1159-like isoform X2 [Procambarus clarkii]